ncbi:MAG: hypothetical protein ACP5O0_08245 [Acidimicrobiales bacterium]
MPLWGLAILGRVEDRRHWTGGLIVGATRSQAMFPHLSLPISVIDAKITSAISVGAEDRELGLVWNSDGSTRARSFRGEIVWLTRESVDEPGAR